jgi:hypothetical protein
MKSPFRIPNKKKRFVDFYLFMLFLFITYFKNTEHDIQWGTKVPYLHATCRLGSIR